LVGDDGHSLHLVLVKPLAHAAAAMSKHDAGVDVYDVLLGLPFYWTGKNKLNLTRCTLWSTEWYAVIVHFQTQTGLDGSHNKYNLMAPWDVCSRIPAVLPLIFQLHQLLLQMLEVLLHTLFVPPVANPM
jgi:hypothetical protein